MSKEDLIKAKATVLECLPNANFKVQLEPPSELIVIGREEGTTDSNNSKMSCSELIIYSRALTDQEFQEVHNNVNGYYNLG